VSATSSSSRVRGRNGTVGLRIVGATPSPVDGGFAVGRLTIGFDVPPDSVIDGSTHGRPELALTWSADTVIARISIAD
jgi:hypothetical protein